MGDRIAKLMPPLIMGRDTPLAACLEVDPKHPDGFKMAAELRSLYATDPDAKRVVDVARGLEGLRRQDGIHAAAVVITTALGAGARGQIDEQIEKLGSNTLLVFPQANQASGARGAQGSGGRLTEDDAKALVRGATSIAAGLVLDRSHPPGALGVGLPDVEHPRLRRLYSARRLLATRLEQRNAAQRSYPAQVSHSPLT